MISPPPKTARPPHPLRLEIEDRSPGCEVRLAVTTCRRRQMIDSLLILSNRLYEDEEGGGEGNGGQRRLNDDDGGGLNGRGCIGRRRARYNK